jgi:hypothetical protein
MKIMTRFIVLQCMFSVMLMHCGHISGLKLVRKGYRVVLVNASKVQEWNSGGILIGKLKVDEDSNCTTATYLDESCAHAPGMAISRLDEQGHVTSMYNIQGNKIIGCSSKRVETICGNQATASTELTGETTLYYLEPVEKTLAFIFGKHAVLYNVSFEHSNNITAVAPCENMCLDKHDDLAHSNASNTNDIALLLSKCTIEDDWMVLEDDFNRPCEFDTDKVLNTATSDAQEEISKAFPIYPNDLIAVIVTVTSVLTGMAMAFTP